MWSSVLAELQFFGSWAGQICTVSAARTRVGPGSFIIHALPCEAAKRCEHGIRDGLEVVLQIHFHCPWAVTWHLNAFDTFVVKDKLDVLWCSLLAESTQLVAYSHRGKTRQHIQNLAAWKGMERPRFSHRTCFAKSIRATANNNVKASAKVRIPAILSKRDLVWEQIRCLHFGATVAFNAAPIQQEHFHLAKLHHSYL